MNPRFDDDDTAKHRREDATASDEAQTAPTQEEATEDGAPLEGA